jgi:DNA-binding MarR family transcriptional regulator
VYSRAGASRFPSLWLTQLPLYNHQERNGYETIWVHATAMTISLRPSQALQLWQQVTLSEVQDDAPDLTMRQMAILLTIYLERPPHTVRGLAAKLNVTKPVITRALDTMGRLKLVSRHRDEQDRRNVLVKRTVEGALYLERFGDAIIAKALELPI